MPNSYAINGYNYYDPYFAQAYNYPNYLAAIQQAGAIQTAGPVQTATTTTAAIETQKKKDHSTAKTILGTVAAIGAAALCHKAYKVGNGEGLAKLGDGFKTMFNNLKSKVAKRPGS